MGEPRQTFSDADLLSAGAQLCYIYTLHASNDPERRPRYVGFTCRPNNRESEHHRAQKNGRKGEWVAQLLSLGQRAILTVVHSFRSDDFLERGVVEASWIEAYRSKFPDLLNDHGAGNGLAKTTEKLRKKRSEVMKKRCADPNFRKQKSEQMKRRYADPIERERLNAINKQRVTDPAYRQKRREFQKELWANPDSRKKLEEAIKRKVAHPVTQKNYRAAMANPEWKRKHSEGMKQRCADPQFRKKMSENTKKQFSDPKARKKVAEATRKLWENPKYRAQRKATFERKRLKRQLDEL